MPKKKTVSIDKRNIVLSPGRPQNEKRQFILEYLGMCRDAYLAGERLEEGDYVQSIYNAWVNYCDKVGIKPGSSGALRQVIYYLKMDGAIEQYATREATREHFWPRNYYRVILD